MPKIKTTESIETKIHAIPLHKDIAKKIETTCKKLNINKSQLISSLVENNEMYVDYVMKVESAIKKYEFMQKKDQVFSEIIKNIENLKNNNSKSLELEISKQFKNFDEQFSKKLDEKINGVLESIEALKEFIPAGFKILNKNDIEIKQALGVKPAEKSSSKAKP